MTSTDFSQAQQRLATRRRLPHDGAHHQLSHASTAFDSLPSPLRRLGQAGTHAWTAISGREGTRPAFRVGQVDADLLDGELVELLKGQTGEALKYFGVSLLRFPSPLDRSWAVS